VSTEKVYDLGNGKTVQFGFESPYHMRPMTLLLNLYSSPAFTLGYRKLKSGRPAQPPGKQQRKE
jgi:hypothetical protein